MIDSPSSRFFSTARGALAPLADTRGAGAHTHSQAHAALSDFLDPDGSLALRRGTQHGADWGRYLDSIGDDPARVRADLDRFHRQWSPDQVARGRNPLISDAVLASMRASYDSERKPVLDSSRGS